MDGKLLNCQSKSLLAVMLEGALPSLGMVVPASTDFRCRLIFSALLFSLLFSSSSSTYRIHIFPISFASTNQLLQVLLYLSHPQDHLGVHNRKIAASHLYHCQ